ncbi:uncharacterized protein Pyn_11463 [Prunus yedoensis var. nudiflora]|uniref:Uncharacterized protein n=1 Tax=Prunus yedoensis var. nudiflora TaxID=2094558 RepID=A0A314YIS1_PRUYE|nr:uncharacterized protein Pyn_11463 [Prunus yedoensis var. nudiflora]
MGLGIETQRIAMHRKRKPADNAIEIGNKEEQIQVMGKKPKTLNRASKALFKVEHCAVAHFAHAKRRHARVSRTLYLEKPGDSSGFDSEHNNCTCYDASDFLFNECNGHQFHMILAKYKIPLRNAEEVINNHNDAKRKSGTKRKFCIEVCPTHHKCYGGEID